MTPVATVTFTLVGNLADFGADPRAGVRVRIVGTPRIKVDDGTIYSDQPETVTTDSTGAFTTDLISTPGLWYQVSTPFVRAVNPVHVAAYIPDPDDPTTGTAFAAGVTVDLADVMDEDPTPGYDGVFLGGGGGGVTDHAALTGRSTANSHPISAITGLQAALDAAATDSDLTTHAADTTAVHGITDTAALVVTTDPRLTDARAPSLHAASHGTGQVDAVSPASIGAAVTGHTHTGTYAPVLGADDNYVTDVEKAALHTHPAVIAQGATAADARTAIEAGTSSFSGVYADLTSKPTLGTAAATAASDYATAAQGVLAGTASQPGHAHAGADITSGTVAYARLPVGTTASTVAAGDDSRITGALQASTAQAINAQTGTSYTLQASDAGKLVTLSNTGAITLNAPGSVFSAGQRVDVLVINTGMATVVGTSGATANGTPSLVSRAQWSAFTVLWTSATAAVAIGDLA